jgi:hypothetical protein
VLVARLPIFPIFATIPIAPVFTGMITLFMSHIRCVCIHKLSDYCLSASFCTTFLSASIATYISMHGSSLFLFFLF